MEDGNGKMNGDGVSYQYPPLWGNHSYNMGAGLYRLSRFAGYVKSNMPQGSTYDNPQLTDEEAWDVAAYVNSQPRPAKDLSKDWPRLSGKPIDHPFGPYNDNFSEQQHKYGPFEPIAALRKKNP
jgi:thiosulfate dehydrogenase